MNESLLYMTSQTCRQMNVHCMQTHTGRVIDLTRFDEPDVSIADICHSLSQIIRFTGHADLPYTVAQHSLLVASLAPREVRLWALLHDASEAYLGDVASPLKTLLPEYRELEERFQKVIAGRFGLPWPIPQEVKDADRAALMIEKRDLLSMQYPWPGELEADPDIRINLVLTHQEARASLRKAIDECIGD